MRTALPAALLCLALAGCADHTPAPPTGPASPPPSTTPGQGPPAAVPRGALLTPSDLGPGWAAAHSTVPPCTATYRYDAARPAGFAHARGTLTETVATGVDVPAAVRAWRTNLGRCGYALRDDALGDASVAGRSRDGGDAVLVTGTEGVLVVLHAHGALAGAQDELDGWADLALGTSCVAAPDGCH